MEQLIRARESSDLSDSPSTEVSEVDWLRASGAVGQRHPLAMALWRLIEQGDKRALHACYDGMIVEVMELDGGKITNPVHVVANVLLWMMEPRCGTCHGRAKQLIPGTPTLSDHDCETCYGTGDKPLAGDHERSLYERVTAMRREAAAAIARKM